jgi:hypothetical protein
VDLWDLTKLLFRRWYAFLPMLLASSAAVVFISQGVKPDYSAVGHLQLIPPIGHATEDRAGWPTNPWADLGIPALGNAAILRVQDTSVLDRMVALGLSDNYSVTMHDRETHLSIEAVGSSPAQASSTIRELMRLLDTEVAAQQERLRVAEAARITTLPLDEGDKVTLVDTTKKRVIIVAAGLAVLLSVALTVGLDVLLRRRRARRTSRRAEAAAVAPTSPAPSARARDVIRGDADESTRVAGGLGPPAGGAAKHGDELVGSVRQAASRSKSEPIETSEATVVLPVSHTRRIGREYPSGDQ